MRDIALNCRGYAAKALPVLISCVFLCGCDAALKKQLNNAGPGQAAELIERNQDFYARHLRIGMPRGEALALFPKPHNTNVENVCVWVFGTTVPEAPIADKYRLDWQWLETTRGSSFIVFVDGKLATPLCAGAAMSPSQALEKYDHLTIEQAQSILGVTGPTVP